MQQQYLEDSERDQIFQTQKTILENKKCFDCSKKNPNWASVYLGLYICYDCAGKHRQYGVQFTFVRSLDYDKWTQRQMTFMEIGGNAKAQEFFSKHGMTAPYDYKNPIVDKYKQQQTKKADSILGATQTTTKVETVVSTTQKTEEKVQNPVETMIVNTGSSESKIDPFNNVKIDKEQTKTKGFTVEFTKKPSNPGGSKGRLAAKKIDNIDLDALTLQEDSKSSTGSMISIDTTDSSMGPKHEPATKEEEVIEVKTVTSSRNNIDESDEDTLKKFKSAKSISSSSFRGNQTENKDPNVDTKRFANATAISSDQYFGNGSKDSKIDYSQTVDNAKEFFSGVGEKFTSVGGKLKDKAGALGTVFSDMNTKLMTKWQDRNKHLEKK
jgi:ADP-ribosylation factor GTPase-activating protein 2/3